MLVRQFFDVNNQVQIDQCWQCSGIWLDVGELEAIRSQYASNAERKKAINAYVDDCVAGHLRALAESGQERVAELQEQHRNVFAAFATELRQLLHGDDELS